MNGIEAFDTENIQSFYINDMTELQLVSSSKGNQRKWYIKEKDIYVKEQFFYQERYWKDYLVEVIASEIGRQLPEKCTPVLQQNVCKIIDFDKMLFGVYSYNFANNKRYVSFK